MGTCLVICRDVASFGAIEHIRSGRPVVVASEDPAVHRAAMSVDGVQGATFFDRSESFWAVADDVRATLTKLDAWLASLDPALPAELTTWAGTIEGGLLGQRIQDTLLAIRSNQLLIQQFAVEEIWALGDAVPAWDAEVLTACARTASVPIRFIDASWRRRASERIARAATPFAKAVYLFAREVSLGAARLRASSLPSCDRAAVFQVCSTARKHVDNVRYVMQALSDRGQRSIALCWSAGERFGNRSAAAQLTATGVAAVDLERFVSVSDVAGSALRSMLMASRARARQGDLDGLEYRGVPLLPLLRESLRHFFLAVLPVRLRCARALAACLSGSQPSVIKPWAGADSFEGKLALRLTAPAAPLYVNYWVGVGLPGWPYTDASLKPDVFLAKSAAEAALAKKEYGIGDERVRVVGQPRWSHERSSEARKTPAQSRQALSLPLQIGPYVGVDMGAALRGYQSRREQVDLLRTVLDVAAAAPQMVVALKPHPAHAIEHLRPLVESYAAENVVLLPQTAPVEPFLNAVDLVISKYSTLILEAVLAGRCAIAAILDGDDRFKAFGDMPAVVRSASELRQLLTRLARGGDELALWLDNQRRHQDERLPQFYVEPTLDPAAAAADALMEHLQCH